MLSVVEARPPVPQPSVRDGGDAGLGGDGRGGLAEHRAAQPPVPVIEGHPGQPIAVGAPCIMQLPTPTLTWPLRTAVGAT
jgi:hypothetical protein